MDPITSAIVTALSAGAIGGITDTAKAAVADSYNKLKDLLTRKHGANSNVMQAVAQLETQPELQDRKETLQEEIATIKAEQDNEILAAAKHVLTLMQPQQAGLSKFTIQNNGPVQGQVMESKAPITMNFGELPKSE